MKKPFILRAWLISALRRASYRFPAHYTALNSAKRDEYIVSSTGKHLKRVFYRCATCKEWFQRKQVVVDHIEPVVDPEVGFPVLSDGSDDWTTYIKRMFCCVQGLQCLCKECHKIKTREENSLRRSNKRNI